MGPTVISVSTFKVTTCFLPAIELNATNAPTSVYPVASTTISMFSIPGKILTSSVNRILPSSKAFSISILIFASILLDIFIISSIFESLIISRALPLPKIPAWHS